MLVLPLPQLVLVAFVEAHQFLAQQCWVAAVAAADVAVGCILLVRQP